MISLVEDHRSGVAIHSDGNEWDIRSISCTHIKNQEVTDGAGHKQVGRKYLEWKNETMKNFTTEKTLDVWKVTVEDVNDPTLLVCLQKGRKLEDNSFAW